MELKTFNKYIVAALVVQGLLSFLALLSFLSFRLYVRTYRPPFPVSDDKIMEQVSISTHLFLTNLFTNMGVQISDTVSTRNETLPKMYYRFFGVSQLKGRNFAYCDGVWYGVGDYIDLDGQSFMINYVDFDRQRLYCAGPSNKVAIVLAGRPRASEDGGERQREILEGIAHKNEGGTL